MKARILQLIPVFRLLAVFVFGLVHFEARFFRPRYRCVEQLLMQLEHALEDLDLAYGLCQCMTPKGDPLTYPSSTPRPLL